jgi:trans-aconitate methyltransferase
MEFVPSDASSILDLGCGTGTLTEQLQQEHGGPTHRVLGVDSSPEMVKAARRDHPKCAFDVADATHLPYDHEWNVVFSNAVFHWIPDHVALLRSVHHALVSDGTGRLVCEFGAAGNIQIIETALNEALHDDLGIDRGERFNFPAATLFASNLVACGFVCDEVYEYERPTPLSDGWEGLREWILQFCEADFEPLSAEQRDAVLTDVERSVCGDLWDSENQRWVADYRRLRAVATAV